MRCLTVWTQGSTNSQNGGWNGTTDRVRIQNTGTSRTKLCSDRQGSVGDNVRSEAVPQLYTSTDDRSSSARITSLIYLFGEHRGISETASARVQRWALSLMGYQYSIVHRPGDKLANVDGLSRL